MTATTNDTGRKWLPLVGLATAQFVMVLDQSVMNLSLIHI